MSVDRGALFCPPPERITGEAHWFLSLEGRLLVNADDSAGLIPHFDARFVAGLDQCETHYLGQLDGRHCMAAEVSSADDLVPGLVAENVRALLPRLDANSYTMFSRALQVLAWARNHRFCSRCGAQAQPHGRDMAVVCGQCGYSQYPRITPCVIMLVTRGDEALLARSHRFPDGMFSCLAGFMEAGETAEQAVAREVREETAIEVGQMRYHGSQSWPFPHSLMLGFEVNYARGDIHVDDDEIAEAAWFRHDQLPMVPPQGSIARSLIDSWRGRIGEGSVQ